MNGIFVVSIDLELAWGICDRPLRPALRSALALEREVIRSILAIFSAYEVRATWAVVGHLLTTECGRDGATVHPEIPRPITRNGHRDWFFQHPADPEDPLWSGPEIVDWIRQTSPAQEIGSHSFAHLIYHPATTHREAVRADLVIARRLHDAHELPFVSFVFPRNVVGYRDLLAAAGIRVYRGVIPAWYGAAPLPVLRRLGHLLDFLLAVPPPTVRPAVDELGLVNVPDSMLLLGRNGPRRLVSPARLVRKAVSGLERAAERREVFHLRFHPSNFAYRTDEQLEVLEAIARHAQRLVRAGRLMNLTMGDFARWPAPGAAAAAPAGVAP